MPKIKKTEIKDQYKSLGPCHASPGPTLLCLPLPPSTTISANGWWKDGKCVARFVEAGRV